MEYTYWIIMSIVFTFLAIIIFLFKTNVIKDKKHYLSVYVLSVISISISIVTLINYMNGTLNIYNVSLLEIISEVIVY